MNLGPAKGCLGRPGGLTRAGPPVQARELQRCTGLDVPVGVGTVAACSASACGPTEADAPWSLAIARRSPSLGGLPIALAKDTLRNVFAQAQVSRENSSFSMQSPCVGLASTVCGSTRSLGGH